MRVQVGDVLSGRELPTLRGTPVRLPDPNALVHLQFRRYAGCPICNLHVRAFIARRHDIEAAGLRELFVFHSGQEALLRYQGDVPFDIVPDPSKALYREFGVERSRRAILHPSAVLATIRGWSPSLPLRAGPGGHLGLPADILIDTDGRVLACKYGVHANDQWDVDTVLSLVRRRTPHSGRDS